MKKTLAFLAALALAAPSHARATQPPEKDVPPHVQAWDWLSDTTDRVFSYWRDPRRSGRTMRPVQTGGSGAQLDNLYVLDIPGANGDLGRIADHADLEPSGGVISVCARVSIHTAENLRTVLINKTDLSGDSAIGPTQTNLVREGQVRIQAVADGYGHGSLVGALPINTWGHLCAVWNFNDSPTTRAFYVNGSLQSQYSVGTDPVTWTDTADDWSVGDFADNAGDRTLDHRTDDVMIFHAELTPAQVWCLYNNNGSVEPTAGCGVTPVGFYRMGDDDGGTGTTITNIGSLGPAHPMTLEGTAAIVSGDVPTRLTLPAVSTNDRRRQVLAVIGQSNASCRGAVPATSPFENGDLIYIYDNNGPIGTPNGTRTVPVDPAAYATTDVSDDRTGQTAVFPASEDSGAPGFCFDQVMANHILETYTSKQVGIIPCALGGSEAEDWGMAHDQDGATQPQLFGECEGRMQAAAIGDNAEIAGFIVFQGLCDAQDAEEAQHWRYRQRAVINAYRTQLGNPSTPVVFVQHWPTQPTGAACGAPNDFAAFAELRAEQAAVCDDLTDCTVVTAPDGPFTAADNVHLDTGTESTDGHFQLGEDVADAVMATRYWQALTAVDNRIIDVVYVIDASWLARLSVYGGAQAPYDNALTCTTGGGPCAYFYDPDDPGAREAEEDGTSATETYAVPTVQKLAEALGGDNPVLFIGDSFPATRMDNMNTTDLVAWDDDVVTAALADYPDARIRPIAFLAGGGGYACENEAQTFSTCWADSVATYESEIETSAGALTNLIAGWTAADLDVYYVSCGFQAWGGADNTWVECAYAADFLAHEDAENIPCGTFAGMSVGADELHPDNEGDLRISDQIALCVSRHRAGATIHQLELTAAAWQSATVLRLTFDVPCMEDSTCNTDPPIAENTTDIVAQTTSGDVNTRGVHFTNGGTIQTPGAAVSSVSCSTQAQCTGSSCYCDLTFASAIGIVHDEVSIANWAEGAGAGAGGGNTHPGGGASNFFAAVASILWDDSDHGAGHWAAPAAVSSTSRDGGPYDGGPAPTYDDDYYVDFDGTGDMQACGSITGTDTEMTIVVKFRIDTWPGAGGCVIASDWGTGGNKFIVAVDSTGGQDELWFWNEGASANSGSIDLAANAEGVDIIAAVVFNGGGTGNTGRLQMYHAQSGASTYTQGTVTYSGTVGSSLNASTEDIELMDASFVGAVACDGQISDIAIVRGDAFTSVELADTIDGTADFTDPATEWATAPGFHWQQGDSTNDTGTTVENHANPGTNNCTLSGDATITNGTL